IQRMPIVLTAAQNRFLRGQAHDLHAMLQVGGKGLTDAVVAAVASALEHHDVIKVKVAATEREARDPLIEVQAARADADGQRVEQGKRGVVRGSHGEGSY